MSNFAQIDGNNIVIQVLRGDDSFTNEGHDWFVENLGGTWVKTSYNGTTRKNYAGKGYTYDSVRDAFIAPKASCHPEEVLDEKTCTWVCNNPEHDVVI